MTPESMEWWWDRLIECYLPAPGTLHRPKSRPAAFVSSNPLVFRALDQTTKRVSLSEERSHIRNYRFSTASLPVSVTSQTVPAPAKVILMVRCRENWSNPVSVFLLQNWTNNRLLRGKFQQHEPELCHQQWSAASFSFNLPQRLKNWGLTSFSGPQWCDGTGIQRLGQSPHCSDFLFLLAAVVPRLTM